ncbi:MAG: hypothetical protein COB84_10625 [Rhodobacteraceae bacterium]|nr:MAG: hypothetical protein COB84_10625 [Paracoccaceae bacterium]
MNSIKLSKPFIGRVLRFIGFFIIVIGCAAWTVTALTVHFTGGLLYTSLAIVAVCGVACLGLRMRARRLGWLMLLLSAIASAGWYQTIRPSHDRQWAFDVERNVKAQIAGDIVHLEDVRNFEWKTASTANVSWESRDYDLTKLATVDMLTSVWDNPDIAHLLVSFGFSDGKQVVFSVETRKEAHEEFNIKGGFFRQFELILIAATELDIVKLRTNYRKEDVRLYPISLDADQRRSLFISYLELANQLAEKPKFYNTITANCTTTVYPLAQVIKPDMQLDWRLIMSGHLPDYIEKLGGFDPNIPKEQRYADAAITDLASSSDSPYYSKLIRRQITE